MKKSKKNSQSPSQFFEEKIAPLNFFEIADQIAEQLIIISSEGVIVYANEQAVRSYGYPPEEVINFPITKFMNEKMSIKEWQRRYFNKVRDSKAALIFNVERKLRSNGIRSLEIKANYLKHNHKEYIVCVARDMSFKRELEKKLQESQEMYRQFIDQAADGIFTVDLNGYIVYANQSAARLVKMPLATIKGSHFAIFLARNSLVKVWQSFQKVKEGETVVGDEVNIKDKQGNIIAVEFTSSPIYKNNEIIQIYTIFRDISRKRQLESLLRESEKMQTLQDFISGTIHEIHNPLKVIINRMNDILGEFGTRDFEYIGFKEYQEMIKSFYQIKDQLNNCYDTSSKLTAFSKKKAGLKKDTSDVNEALRKVSKAIEYQLDKANIHLQMKLAKNLPEASIDHLDLEEVFYQILSNAVQSIEATGKIELRTSFLKREKQIRIDCIDDGIGISRENMPRIFEPFFSTKERAVRKTSGLGLSIVYSIIKACKGDIKIVSSLRRGTHVSIFIPAFKK